MISRRSKVGVMNGLDIARRRIAKEAGAQTGVLDLGRLGLTRLPDELFKLTQLRFLNLGSGFVSEHGGYDEASANIATNEIQRDLIRLVQLPVLKELSLRSLALTDLEHICSLQQLCSLNCSYTSISDLTPLKGLTALQTLDCNGTSISDLTPLNKLAALQTLILLLRFDQRSDTAERTDGIAKS